MKYIPSRKINNDPIVITLSGVGFEQIKNGIGFRRYFWEKLIGSGANLREINEIADAIENEVVIFIGEQGFISGKLIETPTQHVLFNGACKSIKSIKAEQGRDDLTLEEIVEDAQLGSLSAIVETRKPFQHEVEFNAWLREILKAADENPDYDSGQVLYTQRAVVFRVKNGITPQSWEYERVEYKPSE
jgi:hypothetical protein